MNMGNYDGRFLKMEYTIWLSALIVLVTLATPTHSEPRVVCYYTNWSVYRSGTARFNPQNINPYLCTHLVYAFGGFTKDNTLKPFDKYQDIEKGGYAKFTGLKTYNKKLKTLLAIGGWNEGSARFSPMVATKSSRKEFVKNAIRFLRQNHFDGLDLDWEYPAFRDGGKAKDRENYAKLVKELREEFEKESAKTGKSRLLLTMAVPAGIEYIQKGFDVKTLNRYLDWMNLLTYDYHSAFEPAVNHHAPLYPLEEPSEYSVDNELNIDYTIKFYLENGADRDKLVVGIPTYGRSYTLFNPDAVEIGSPADGPGEQGEATKEKGYLAYYEICEALKPKSRRRRATDSEEEEEEESEESEEEEEQKPWTVMHPNPAAMGPVAYRGNQWVGYDDIDIVRKKAEYVAQNGLGGIMFWSIDNDDFRGACHDKPYPLIEAAKEAYLKGLENTKFIATDTVVKTDSDRRRKNRPRTTTTTTTTTTPKSSKRTSTPSWNVQTPEPPTTPDPGADFKCKDEGFFPHPRDCKKYFWCLDSGPSNLGIVAHQFTCPSGLYFNKAADSCDFARNVLCKVQTTTAKPRKSTTKTTPTTTTSTTTVTTTTRAPVRVSTRNSVLFRTTTTTTPEPEIEDDEEEVVDDDSSDDDAEDPKVIKELIDLIKKVGGVEQLEKQLLLSESSSSTNGAVSTTPTSFNKRLYQKVLDRAIGKNKYTSKTTIETVQQNSRSGPQNAGIEATADKDRLIRKGRPEYVTINRARSSPKTEEPEESEEVEESEEEEVQVSRSKISFGSESSVASTAKPLQYVNIRRARPTTEATEEAEEPSRSRNALFERSGAFVAVDNLNSIDIINTKRDNIPEYVTIKRNRPSYAETTTIGYSSSELDTSKETELEREISSQVSQPQYTNIVRTRSTTQPPQVQPQTPEPTTILSVQISSLLNEPSEEEEPTTQTQTTLAPEIEKPEPELTTVPTTTPTTTTTSAPSSTTSTTRRSLLRRRGSTSPTTTTSTTEAPESSSQVTRDRRPFLRRTKPTRAPETSTEPIETTTRNLTRGPNRFRNRVQSTTARSDRPTRTYLRRRTGASAATSVNTTSSATTSSATTSSTSASLTSRRTLFVNRRRPGVTTLSPTTTEPLPNEPTVKTTTLSPTAFIESEEVLQEIGEIDYLEDSTQVTTDLPRTTEYVQRRRPLVQLQIKTEDQNQAATTEEEKKRQSKKYSSSFKQNELNEIIRQRTSGEAVDIVKEGKTNTESYTSETAAAVALAAHQLIAAPVPVTIDYEEDAQSTNEPYKYTTAYTITQQSEDMLKTPAYTSSKKYYDPTSNIYSSVEVENLSTSTYSTDNTNIRSKQRYTTIGGFSGRSSNSQDVVELPSTVPTYTTNAATKASRRLTGRRYRGRTTTTTLTTDADVISTIQPSTYEPVTDKRGQIKFKGEYVDSFAGFGFGAAKTTDVVRQLSGTQRYASGVNRGSGSRYRINAGVPVTTDSTYEARTTDIRGPEKYKNSVSTFDGTVDVQYNTGDQSNLDVQTDEHGSEKYSTGKYQDSVSTFDSNVDVQSNVGVQTVTDERSSGRFSTGVNRYRISSEAQVAPTDATYEAKITDIRGPAKYSAGQHQGSVSTLVTNEYAAGVQSNANVQYNLGAQSNTGERYSTNAQSNVINIDHNVGAQSNSGGLQSVTSTEVKTSDLRGSEKYATGKYQGSISTNADIQSTAGAPSNTGAWANTDAQSNVNIEYNSNGQVNTGQSVASTEAKTTDIRGSEKYTTGKYEGSISTNADIQSTPGAQSNTGAWVNTDAQSNVNIEYNSSGQINTGQSVASTEVKTTDIRGSEKYTTGKSQGSISTHADIQSTAGAQSNTGAWVSTDAQSNVNIEYNSNGQANSGQSVASTEVKTTDIHGSEKYTTGKYQGSIFTNADIQSTAGAQSNTGAWVNTDPQSNVNLEYNSNRQVNTGQSVASTEVKTTDIRGSEKYSTGKYEGSISTNAAIQSTAGAQFNTGAWVNTDAQSNLNVEYNSNGQANSGQSVASTEVKTTDIRGSEKYTGQSVASTEVKMTDIRGSEKYTTGKYEGSISTNADIQSTAGAQYNTGAWVNTDAQSNVNLEYNSNRQVNTGQSVASTEVKTTDIRGSEKYTTGKYEGSISTNAGIQSTAGAQFNTGAWVNTDAQSNLNVEYNSNGQANSGQSVASTEVKTTDIRGSEKYTGQSVASTEVNMTDIRGSEKYTTGKYEGSISTNAGIQSTAGAQFNTGAWVDTGAQSNVNIEYNSNGQINAGQSSASTEVKTADIRGSDKYSTGKYRGSISTLEANVDVELTSGLQSNANVQYNLGAQSNTGERVSTNAQSNLKIESNSNAQADAGQSVTTTEVKTTDMRGSDSYSTGKYQNSISTFGSNVDVQSNAGVHLATDERGSEKYSIGVNNYEISAEVPIITDVKYGATDVRGSEKYKNSVSTFGTNVDAQSNANVQYDISTQSNTGERHIADARSNLNIEYNANAQSDASTQSITSAGLKTTEIRGLDKLSTETNQGSVSRFETNVNKESYSGVQLATDERGSGKYSVARNRYRISTEAPVTDTRGSEKYKSSVSTFDTNADVQSNTGTKSNVEVLRTNDEQSAEKYSVDVNKSSISANALVTGTDATYGAGTTDIRGSEKYKTSVSSLETNGNVQLSNAGVQSNLGLQITTDERGSEKYSTETYQSSISLEANKDVQNNANVQYNIDSQFNTGTQSVNAAEVKTTDISGSEKYSSELNQGSVTNFEKNVNAQSNSGVRFTTDERNSGKYSVGVKRYRTTTEAPVTTDSTFEARVTDLRGSEKYKNSVSAFESNVDVIPNARTQSNVGAQISTDEKSAGKYSVRMNRFHVSADKPVTTTDATYGDRTTDIRRGSDKYETSVSTFETNVGVQSNLGVQTVIDERGSEKYSTNKYEGFISLESSKDAQSNANVEYIKDLQSNTGAQSVTSAEVSTSDIRGSDKYTTGSNQGTISSFETNVNVQSNLGVQLETDEGSSGKYSVNVNRYRINAEAPVTTTSTSYEGKTTDVRGSEKYKTSVSTLETNVDVKSNAQSQSNAGVQTVSAEQNSEKYSTGKNEGSVSTLGTNTEAQSNVQILNDERRGEKYSMGGNRRRIGVKRFRVTTEAPVHSTDATYATSITDMRGSEKYSAGRNKELISTFETNADLQSDVQYNTGAELITPTVPITFGVKTTDISGSDKYSIGGNRRRIGVKRFRVTTEAPVLITDATYATSTTDMRGSEKYSAGRNKELISTFETNADLQSDVNVQYNTGAELITPTVPITFGVKTTDISGSDKYSSGKHEGSAFEANIEIRSNGGFQSVTSPVPVAYEVKTTDRRGPLRYTSGQNQSSILNVETNVDVQSNSGTQSYINLQYDTTAQSNTGIQSNTNARYNANAQSNTGEFRNNNKQSNINVEYDSNALSNANLAYNVDAQSNANIEYNTDAQSNVNLQYNVDAKSEAGVQSVSSTKIKSTDIRGSDKYSTGKYEGSISTLGANVDIQSNEGIQSVSSQVPISYYEVNTTDNRGPMKYAAGEYQSSVSTFEANLQSNGDAQSYANVQYDSNMQTNGDSQYNLNTQSNVNIETDARVQSTVDKQTNTNAQFNANAQFNSHAQNNSSGQYSTDAQSYTNIDYNASAQAINTQYNAGAQSHTGEVKSVISSVPVIYEMKTTDIQSLEKNSSGKYQTSTFETNVDVQSNAQYNASVQSDAIIQSNTNGQFISSTVPLSYEFNATEIRGPAKYSSGTNKESVTSFQGNANGQSVSSSRPTSYKIRTKGRRPTKFSGGYRNKITNIESDADVISTLQPTTYESQTTDISGETKYSTAEYRDSATRFENTADGISTIQPTISTFEIKTKGPGKYWTGQYRSRTSSSLQTDEDSISTVQPTTYEADTTDIRGSSRYSAEEYRGRVSEVQTNTDIPFVSTIQSYESDTSDTRGPIRYNTVNAYTDGTYNENTDSDVISNRISTTYAPEIVNTRVPTRFTTANAYRGSTVQTDTEIPSTVSTITEYSFDSTLGKSASRTSQTGYRGRYSSEADISGRTDVRQPTRLITGSYSGRGTRPTIASESIDSLTLSGGSSEATQERGAAKYYVTSDITDIREPAQFSSSLDLRGSARFTGSETLTGRTIRPGFLPQNTIDPILSGITINIGAEKGDSTARYNSATDGSATTISDSEYKSRKSSQSATNVVSSGDELSINIGESIATTASPSTVKSARPTGFTPSLLNLGEIAEEKSSLKYQISQKSNSYESNEGGPSTARYEENEKIPVPVIYAYSSAGSSSSQSSSSSSSAEPSYFTREYLLESPVTKTYEEEYQYLSPVTIPSTTGRKSIRRKIYRKYNAQKPVENVSTTTTTEAPSPSTEAPTPKRRTTTVKPFQKLTVRRVPLQSVQKITLSKKEIEEAKQKFKPSKDYDYYDDNHEKIAKYDGTKVIVRGEGNIQCLDIGNFPHPTSCKKFISCARIESGAVLGWEYICPKGLSFDPVGGICNWSAGLGCNEKDI